MPRDALSSPLFCISLMFLLYVCCCSGRDPRNGGAGEVGDRRGRMGGGLLYVPRLARGDDEGRRCREANASQGGHLVGWLPAALLCIQ